MIDPKPSDLQTSARRRLLLGLPVLAAATTAGIAAPALASTSAQTRLTDHNIDLPLGIGLEGWAYPGPVSQFSLMMSGQRVRMAYMDFAPTAAANGRAIFLLHGKNFDSSYWAGPIGWLRDAGFRVVVPDQIGFNKSAKPDLTYRFEDLAANTMALADSLGLSKIAVLGHSTGGMLAVRLTTLYPERIDRLVLEDPIGLVDYRIYIAPQPTAKLEAAERAYTAESYRAFIAHYFPLLPPAQYEPFVIWRMRVALSTECDRFNRASALTYQMIYSGAVVDLYSQLKPPVLLTAGTADKSAPLAAYATPACRAAMPTIPEAAKDVIKTVPNGKLVTFAGVGHVPHLERRDDFQREVLAFLK